MKRIVLFLVAAFFTFSSASFAADSASIIKRAESLMPKHPASMPAVFVVHREEIHKTDPTFRLTDVNAYRIVRIVNGQRQVSPIYVIEEGPAYQAALRGDDWGYYALACVLMHEVKHTETNSEVACMTVERNTLVRFIATGRVQQTDNFNPFDYLAQLTSQISTAKKMEAAQ